MKLYLVQHGEAVDKSVDPQRPLSEAGIKIVERVAALITRAEAAPKCILHSGKTRARQTAELFSEHAATGTAVIDVDGIAPLDDVEAFADRIAGFGDEIMVCGHQPFMGKLVSHLLFGKAEVSSVEFLPGTLARLDRGEGGHWVLCWLVRPEMLDQG
jgi:phosphohistidine phosphatase